MIDSAAICQLEKAFVRLPFALLCSLGIVYVLRDFDSQWELTKFSVNIVLTFLIAGRLLWMSCRVKRYLGYRHAKKYTSVAAMLIECALPYSVTGLRFIICYIIDFPLEEPLISILSQLIVRPFGVFSARSLLTGVSVR
jgi:hypothetical protein